MSHKGIRTLLEQTALKLRDDIQVSYAKETDFNQGPKKSDLMINIAPLTFSATYADNNSFNYSVTWSVTMSFYKPDKSGDVDLYPEILDETGDLVNRFINSLNFFQSKSDQIIIQGISSTSFIKALADQLTGWLLTFQIQAVDNFEYCPDCP